MKLITLSSIIGHNCGNPDCEHGKANDHFKFSFVMDRAVLESIMGIRTAFQDGKFKGGATVAMPSEIKVIHYKLINTNVRPVAGVLYKDLQWEEIDPPFPLKDLVFYFHIDSEDILSFSVEDIHRVMRPLSGYLGHTRKIYTQIPLDNPEYPTPDTRVTVSLDGGGNSENMPPNTVVH